MTTLSIARTLFHSHNRYRVDSLSPANCRHRPVSSRIRKAVRESHGSLVIERSGTSIEGKSIPLIRFGKGKLHVLLWSQMHGDEPTATLALMDILSFLSHEGLAEYRMDSIARKCSLFFVPMLNPDGAQRVSRFTTAGVDMNRDARKFSTPEARFLRSVHRQTRPVFAFNLHDQALSTVGSGPAVSAIGLLAPFANQAERPTAAQVTAMRVASAIAGALRPHADGHITTYDDSHEPRAFGDAIQGWGTSTILVESGHWPNDREKRFVRKLNFVGLLSALNSIATGSYKKEPLAGYRRLKPNGKRAFDTLVRNVTLSHGAKWEKKVSIGLQLERVGRIADLDRMRVSEVGDLHGFGCLHQRNAKGKRLGAGKLRVDGVYTARHIERVLKVRLKRG